MHGQRRPSAFSAVALDIELDLRTADATIAAGTHTAITFYAKYTVGARGWQVPRADTSADLLSEFRRHRIA